MKLIIAICVSVAAAIAGGLTALAKKWQFGPYLPQDHEIDDFSKPINVQNQPIKPNMPQQTTTQPPIVHPGTDLMPNMPMLVRFCTALMNFEGGPGDPNHLNCNPGDFRCSPVGYLPKYGAVRCSPHGFAIFPTFELGWEYLLDSVHHRAVAHPNWTIYDFFANFAPSTDGNEPRHYAEVVAANCGVSATTILKNLFS